MWLHAFHGSLYWYSPEKNSRSDFSLWRQCPTYTVKQTVHIPHQPLWLNAFWCTPRFALMSTVDISSGVPVSVIVLRDRPEDPSRRWQKLSPAITHTHLCLAEHAEIGARQTLSWTLTTLTVRSRGGPARACNFCLVSLWESKRGCTGRGGSRRLN